MTALWCLRVKPGKKGLNRQLRPVLRGGTGSHTLPNHMIGKRTVNTTLTKGHHARTQRTAKIFLIFHTIAARPIKTVHFEFLTEEDDIARFDSWQYIKFAASEQFHEFSPQCTIPKRLYIHILEC